MLIAIDFDETLTADPDFWRQVIDAAYNRGHKVICVTARQDTKSNRDIVETWMKENDIDDIYTHYTSLASKVAFLSNRGVKVDIWIDDDPRKCALGH